MKKFVLAAIGVAAAIIGQSLAQIPDGHEEIYNEPTRVNLGGRWVVADIALYADAPRTNQLHLALVTDVTKFIKETENDLKNWVATNQDRCGNRWGAGEPQISFPGDSIRFVLELELQVWSCGIRRRGEPGMMAREAGKIDVVLDPYIEAGKLQARLRSFKVEERQGISRILPLEFIAKRVIDAELEKLNENPKFYQAPQPLLDSGFRYRSIEAFKDDDTVMITARFSAIGSTDKFDELVTDVREDGITQKK
ncbi:MAG: hypothetical protein KJN99_09520 [Marinicaulis sp.]|nr:hypothetical protein [Marinicaulis sp.]